MNRNNKTIKLEYYQIEGILTNLRARIVQLESEKIEAELFLEEENLTDWQVKKSTNIVENCKMNITFCQEIIELFKTNYNLE